jgi:hypothetical protein
VSSEDIGTLQDILELSALFTLAVIRARSIPKEGIFKRKYYVVCSINDGTDTRKQRTKKVDSQKHIHHAQSGHIRRKEQEAEWNDNLFL